MKIATIGDSLTQGNPPPEHRHGNPGKYQSFLFQFLERNGIHADIWNFGIGGQVIGQIIDRLPDTLFADVVVIMGGTNDVWRFAGIDSDVGIELVEGITGELRRGFDLVAGTAPRPLVVTCSIPPFGNVKTLHENTHDTIVATNRAIEALCKVHGVHFCDVHEAMRSKDAPRFADPTFVIPDGVHFTPAGNKACGEAIGRCIASQGKRET